MMFRIIIPDQFTSIPDVLSRQSCNSVNRIFSTKIATRPEEEEIAGPLKAHGKCERRVVDHALARSRSVGTFT